MPFISLIMQENNVIKTQYCELISRPLGRSFEIKKNVYGIFSFEGRPLCESLA